jgi:hypothetical protein
LIENLIKKYGFDDVVERDENTLNRNLLIYLKGINDGKWNTKTPSSKELGKHSKYLALIHRKYGNIFTAVKELVGFPSPNVIRYHRYYASIDNCKYEITHNIRRIGYLPKWSELDKPPLRGNNSIWGIYAKYGVKEFAKGGKFYETITDAIAGLPQK